MNDHTAAVQAALGGGGSVYLPAGTYQVNNLRATVPATRIHGDGPATVLRKNGDGPLLTLATTRVSVSDLTLDGAGADFAGPGIEFLAHSPHLTNLEVRETRDSALRFPRRGDGHSAIVSDCVLTVWQPDQDVVAVALPDDHRPTEAANRQFTNVRADDCVLFADAGSDNTKWVGCSARTVTITGMPAKLLMSACRLSTTAAVTLAGLQCAFLGNSFGGDVRLVVTAGTFTGNVVAGRLAVAEAATGTDVGFNACAGGTVDRR